MSRMKDASIDLHNQYADMSVRQLLYEAADPDAYLDEIEAAIRRAVIREASVRTLHIETEAIGASEYGEWQECKVNGVEQAGDSVLRGLPDGDYDLVAKEREP